ncbi:DNA-binding MarR family transcriptional regulator [Neorhizobium huautlense]|uniref:DNA-binding MarR family transcriptional regulator n=1 Tax=Neorhizobium huautlense TaxID=67774 RepID=A0ABT9PM82_9HYPH|nr:DNA-binding MarR family transcriptional regulator [Neorhizobium huautlense]
MLSNVDSIPFSTTLHVRDTCLCLHVQRAARALARRFDVAMKPIGLNNGQFSLMMSLNRPVPATMKSVCDLLAMDRTTLTAALKILERRGLVKSAVDPKDRRGKLLTLTDAGMAMLMAALPIWTRVHGEIDVELGDGGADAVRQTLAPIR